MTITINLWLIAVVALWLMIGCAFAWKMAISTRAVVVLMIAWPLFVVLIILAPAINWYVNRNIPNRKDRV
jgi:hypothetical protein